MREKFGRLALAVALVLGFGAMGACDKEDKADVREIGNDVEEGAEDAGKEVEDAVDDADTDGKDD